MQELNICMGEGMTEIFNCAYDEIVDLSKLVPNPKNNNKHPKEQIDRLAKIIDFQGQRSPVVVSNRSGFIVKGHGRLEAIKKLGWDKCAVDYQDYESEAQEYADMVADNQIATWAEFDAQMLLDEMPNLDIDTDFFGMVEIPKIETEEGDVVQDEVPEEVETRCKRGDIWQLGKHRLMCGDSTSVTDVEKLMNGQKADTVLTDPPYGIDIVKNNSVGGGGVTHFGKVGVGNIVKASTYMKIKGDETTDTAKDNYNIVSQISDNQIIFGGNYFTDFLPPKACWIVWDKENTGNFADVELAWTSFNKGAKLYKWLWNGLCRKGERSIEGKSRVHPTQKPVGLIAEILKDFTSENQVVLDCFGGSGSTLVACEQINRTCLMMEFEPYYCDVIIQRWENLTGKTAERITDENN